MVFSPQWDRKTLVPPLIISLLNAAEVGVDMRAERGSASIRNIYLLSYTKSYSRWQDHHCRHCMFQLCILMNQWPEPRFFLATVTGFALFDGYGVGSHMGSFKNKFFFEMDFVAFATPSSKWHLFSLCLAFT